MHQSEIREWGVPMGKLGYGPTLAPGPQKTFSVSLQQVSDFLCV